MNKKHKSVKVALYSLGCKLNQASYHSTDATLKGGLITGGQVIGKQRFGAAHYSALLGYSPDVL